MERIVSGVRPTGQLHVGNYLGAIKNFVRLQNENDCFFFIADYHSLTTHPNPADLRANVKEVLVTYLACGLDPEKTTLYVQSDVPQIPELYLIFNMLAYKGELERSTTFKEKVSKQPENINAGLLTYPVLMAVDIIIHKATKVPVGKDQQQHLEMTRDFASRFNNKYGCEVFPEPQGFSMSKELIKILSLSGEGKMGKSEAAANTLYLSDTPEEITKKLKRAKTMAAPEPGIEMPDYIASLFTIMQEVSAEETVSFFKSAFADGTIRFGDFKQQLTTDYINYTQPIRERMEEISNNESFLQEIMKHGAEKACASAQATLSEVREIIGIKSFY